jgi:hypothetical protein
MKAKFFERCLTFSHIRHEGKLYTIKGYVKLYHVSNIMGRSYVDLSPITEFDALHIEWEIWRNGVCEFAGQCQDEVKEFSGGLKADINYLLGIQEKYNLNDLCPGIKEQMDFLSQLGITTYDKAVEALGKANLNTPYKYGSGWLIKELPQDVVSDIKSFCMLYKDTTRGHKEAMEDITEYLKSLSDWDKLSIHNNWAREHDPDKEIFYNNREFYDNIIPSSSDLVDKIHDGYYKTQDMFVFFDEYGLISTCEYIDDDNSPFDIELLAKDIYDNRDLFEEFLEEMNKNKNKKKENEQNG